MYTSIIYLYNNLIEEDETKKNMHFCLTITLIVFSDMASQPMQRAGVAIEHVQHGSGYQTKLNNSPAFSIV